MSLKIRHLQTSVYTDTGFINVKSFAQNTCYQGNSVENFVYIDPMRDWKNYADSITNFAHSVGAPAEIISDGAPILIRRNSDFTKKCRFLNIKQSSCEPKPRSRMPLKVNPDYSNVVGRTVWLQIIVRSVFGTMI